MGDGDAEGAIDAFTAADEALEGRADAAEISVCRRRCDIWAQLAQVHRAIGNMDEADRRLSDAVVCLSNIRAVEGIAAVGRRALAQLQEMTADAKEGAEPEAKMSGNPEAAPSASEEQ